MGVETGVTKCEYAEEQTYPAAVKDTPYGAQIALNSFSRVKIEDVGVGESHGT